MEILLEHPEIDIKYCIDWANESWTRTWYGLEKKVLMKQEYGNRVDWIEHFNYLCKFFKDERYIKVDNKPVINIYKSKDIDELEDMLQCWRELAKMNGFDDIYVIACNTSLAAEHEKRIDLIDAFYDFEPGYSTKIYKSIIDRFLYNSSIFTKTMINRIFHTKILERKVNTKKIYKRIVRRSINSNISDIPVYPGIFPMWDNTPRRGYKGMVYIKESPKLFSETLHNIYNNIDENDFIFVNAWNEWGEGCYLEPDTKYKYAFLEAIRDVQNN
jgi:hypothetical protein